MKFNKRTLTVIIAAVAILTLTIGSIAYFTDRVHTDAKAKTAAVSDIIKVTPDPEKYPDGDPDPDTPEDGPGEILEAKWERENPEATEPVAPGDPPIDLSYDLKNIGDSDIDVKETIILTITDAEDKPLNLSTPTPEWQLFHDSVQDKYKAYDGKTKISVEEISGNQIKYTLPGFVLRKGETKHLDYELILNKYTSNKYQGSTCKVDYLVELRQHIDTPTPIDPDKGWDDIRTAEITFAGHGEYKVVPAAN